MAILNADELQASMNLLLPSAGDPKISAAALREYLQNQLDSTRSYVVAIQGGAIASTQITATPIKWDGFDLDRIASNVLFDSEAINSRVLVKEPCLVYLNYEFNGSWAGNEDLTVQVRTNGAINTVTPLTFALEGNGTGDPQLLTVSNQPYLITQAMVDAGGGSAAIEVYFVSNTGNFNLTQVTTSLIVNYDSYSIRV